MAFALGTLIVGANLPSPLYSVYQQRFGFSPLTITVIVSAYFAVLVPSLLLFGSLADLTGMRRVLLPSVVVAMVGTALFAAAVSTWWLFAARMTQGLAIGAASGPLTVALVQTEPRADQGRASVVGSLMTSGGAGLGPVLAGGLAQYAPHPLLLCYLVELAALVLALAAVASLPADPSAQGRWQVRWPRIPADVRRQFALASAVSFLAWAAAQIVLALIPSYVKAVLHSHNLLLGGGAAGTLLLCAALAQVVFANVPPDRALPVGLLLLIAGLGGLIVVGRFFSVPLLFATIAVAGVGQGLGFMGALRRVNAIAPPSAHAEVVSAFYMITYLGGGGPVILVGLLATQIGLVTGVQMAAAVVGTGCLVTFVLLRRS